MSAHHTDRFAIRVVHSARIAEPLKNEIISLCSRAYEEDMRPALETFVDANHCLGYYEGLLVSHALWVTRYLQAGTNPVLRTAYIEAVATDSKYRNRGFASSLMKHIIGEIQDYELAALSPFSIEYYERLGWELWRGALLIRIGDNRIPSPDDEAVMIFRLNRTPPLDLSAPLSAEWREGELW